MFSGLCAWYLWGACHQKSENTAFFGAGHFPACHTVSCLSTRLGYHPALLFQTPAPSALGISFLTHAPGALPHVVMWSCVSSLRPKPACHVSSAPRCPLLANPFHFLLLCSQKGTWQILAVPMLRSPHFQILPGRRSCGVRMKKKKKRRSFCE